MRSFYVECTQNSMLPVCAMLHSLQKLGDEFVALTTLQRVKNRRSKVYRLIFTASDLAAVVIADGKLDRILPCNRVLPSWSHMNLSLISNTQHRVAMAYSVLACCYSSNSCLFQYDKRNFDLVSAVNTLENTTNWDESLASLTPSTSPHTASPLSSPPSSPPSLGLSPSWHNPMKINEVTYLCCSGTLWCDNPFSIVNHQSACQLCRVSKTDTLSSCACR